MENNGWINIKDKLPADGQVCDIVVYWPETKNQQRRFEYIFKKKHGVVDWVNYFQEFPYYQMGLYEMSFGVDENLITHWMPHIPLPPVPNIIWQYKTRQMEDWKDMTNEEYEASKHLARYEFRQVEK